MAQQTASSTEGNDRGAFILSEAEGYRSRDVGTVLSGQTLKAGHVLGKIAEGAATAAADSGNTGNGTCGSVTVAQGAQPGAYRINFVAATTFEVEGPDGKTLAGKGATGSAYTGGGLTFTITAGGTAFAAGDGFTITVAAGSGKFREIDFSSAVGADTAVAVLYDNVDASGGDQSATIMARDCEVNALRLQWPSGATTNQKNAAIAQLLTQGIVVRS